MNCDSICMLCASLWRRFVHKPNKNSMFKASTSTWLLFALNCRLPVEKHLPKACNRKMLQIYEIYARWASKQTFFSANKCEKGKLIKNTKLKLLMNESHLAFSCKCRAGSQARPGTKEVDPSIFALYVSACNYRRSWRIKNVDRLHVVCLLEATAEICPMIRPAASCSGADFSRCYPWRTRSADHSRTFSRVRRLLMRAKNSLVQLIKVIKRNEWNSSRTANDPPWALRIGPSGRPPFAVFSRIAS